MPILFKFSKDGKKVSVAKSLLGKMEEKEFKEKAKEVAAEAFAEKLSGSKKAKVEEVSKRLQELDAMKITVMGRLSFPNPCTRTTTTRYYLGGKSFVNQDGDEAEIFEYQDAIKYGNEFYGEEFMKINFARSREKDLYFMGTKEISKEEYNDFMKEIEVLTSMVSLNKINKEDKVSKKQI